MREGRRAGEERVERERREKVEERREEERRERRKGGRIKTSGLHREANKQTQ